MRAVFVAVVVTLGCTRTIGESVSKRQVNIGEFQFPRTASFPGKGWNTNVNENAEPIYDELLALPKEKKLEKVEKNVKTPTTAKTTTLQSPSNSFVKPTPPSAPPRAIITSSTTKSMKPKSFNIPNSPKTKNPSNIDHSNKHAAKTVKSQKHTTTNDSKQSSNSDLKKIQEVSAEVSGKEPEGEGHINARVGYSGRIIIDLQRNQGNQVNNSRRPLHRSRCNHGGRSSTRSRRPKPSSDSESAEIATDPRDSSSDCSEDSESRRESRRLTRRISSRERKSAEEIFGNLLLVRRDISGLRHDLREVKQLVREISRKQNETDSINGQPPSQASWDHGSALSAINPLREQGHDAYGADTRPLSVLEESASDSSKLIPSLLMISKTTVIPAQAKAAPTFVPGGRLNEIPLTEDSDTSSRLGVLDNLTVETAHQVFPILISSKSSGKQAFPVGSAKGSAYHHGVPVLIAADLMRNRFVLESGRESAKHGALIRAGDRNGNLKPDNASEVDHDDEQTSERKPATTEDISIAHSAIVGELNGQAAPVGQLEWKKEDIFENAKWPFNIDPVDFSVDSPLTVVTREEPSVRFSPVKPPSSDSYSPPEQYLQTSTLDGSGAASSMPSVKPSQTRISSASNQRNNKDSSPITSQKVHNISKTSSVTGAAPSPMANQQVEKYTYKEPESLSDTRAITSSPVEIGVDDYHSTQQAALWPDVLLQGG